MTVGAAARPAVGNAAGSAVVAAGQAVVSAGPTVVAAAGPAAGDSAGPAVVGVDLAAVEAFRNKLPCRCQDVGISCRCLMAGTSWCQSESKHLRRSS